MSTQKTQKTTPPIVLAILDGWGIAPPSKGNAIALAKTPVMDELKKKYAYTELRAHGKHVGLPAHQDGNSEAGHINLGAGRVIEQDSVEISHAIETGTFFKNSAFIAAIDHANNNKSNLHLMGLLSQKQSAHVDPNHLLALLLLCRQKKVKNVFIHLFTDGRDSQKFIAVNLVNQLQKELLPSEQIASIMGRFYSMDRKKSWENIEKAYNALVLGEDPYFPTPEAAILAAYNKGESDEFITPSLITNEYEKSGKSGHKSSRPKVIISNNDSIIFFNLRSDRAREITKTFTQKDFNKKNPGSFVRKKVLKNLCFAAMADFGPDLDNILTAFPSQDLKSTLPIMMSDYKQIYIAETEKYAHVTYFFNGGYPDPIAGEERFMISSPQVKSYDEAPAMSANKITSKVVADLRKKSYNFITLNFANPDMVAHTGNLKAGVKAVEVIDRCIGQIHKQILSDKGTLIITADHGNIEEMINLKTGEIDTKHSINPVPFILVSEKFKRKKLKDGGVLGDVAPTILEIAGIDKPKEMRKGML